MFRFAAHFAGYRELRITVIKTVATKITIVSQGIVQVTLRKPPVGIASTIRDPSAIPAKIPVNTPRRAIY